MQYKDGRIILPVIEFSVSGNTYNVNGINLSYAVFFVKKDRKKFVLLQPAEYTIQTVGANTNLVIQDSALSNVVAIQVALNITKISSDYNVFGTPDITILKDKYNQLEKDMTNLWEYIKKQGVTSDVMNVDVVLPSIADGETYIMRNGSIEATPLISAEDELQKLLDKLVENSQGILDGYVELLKNDIENQTKIFFEENKKEFLNKTEVRKEISYATGTEYKGNNIFGSELKNIIKGQMYYYGNIPYMAKVTATSSTGFLAPDTINFQDIRNSMLYEQLYTNLLEFDKVIYNPGGGSNFWKFFRYGKRATFFISYTLSGEVWLDYTKLASFPIGFKPNTEYVYSEHKIYIQTSNNTGDERLVLRGDGIIIAGVAGKLVHKVIGVIEYIAE